MKKLLVLLAYSSCLMAAEPRYVITQSAQHVKEADGSLRARYDFTLKNNGSEPVCTFRLYDTANQDSTLFDPGKPKERGTAWPTEEHELAGSSSAKFEFSAERLEESNKYGVDWVASGLAYSTCLQAGEQARFSFSAPWARPYFSRPYAWIDGQKTSINIVDKLPPTLHVYLAEIAGGKAGQARQLKASLEVGDQHDPYPQVWLQQIRLPAGKPAAKVTQTAPRNLQDGAIITLPATVNAEYRLQFSAIDASYNRVSIERHVRVPAVGQALQIR